MSAPKTSKQEGPYGAWPSPITARLITAGSTSRDFPCRVDGVTYWQETRPDEEGRTTVVARYDDGRLADLIPYPHSTQSKVHEYGGRSWLIAGGTLFFVAKSDQRVYRLALPQAGGGAQAPDPVPLSPDLAGLRFADFCHDRSRDRLIAVCEDHTNNDQSPQNYIATLPCDGSAAAAQNVDVLVAGSDFYAYPRLSPSGERLCWIAWQHPQMPWDGSELWVGDIDSGGGPGTPRLVAGGASESIFQPAWSPQGQLYFVSDRSGWWNLYRENGEEQEPLFPVEAEFATPLWALGMTTYDFVDGNRVATLFTQCGNWHLGILDTQSGRMAMIPTPFSQMNSIFCADDGEILLVASGPTASGDIAVIRGDDSRIVKLTDSTPAIDPDSISIPEPVSFATGNGDMANGFYYPPTNSAYQGPAEEKPPLVVMCHGGPTGANYGVFSFKVQYWTSRGFALLDVNYRGSTGFGRAYREKINGAWGIVDVEDAAAGVAHLVAEGLVDSDKTIIRGSSAGGYTVLAALTFTDAFRAGASLYGIGDLETLARDTHKFEARYLDSLVGPYPETADIYRQRSPIHHVDKLSCPVIFLQGLEDKVVPPNQAEAMVNALKAKGIAVAYVTFADEGHGFRKAANIKTALEAELYFYREVLGIPAQESLPPVDIANL